MIDVKEIFNIKTNKDFEAAALKVFLYQSERCEVYKQYISLLGINPSTVNTIEQIPFLPIRFFKSKKIYSVTKTEDIIFTSSGTTGMEVSKHYVADVKIYEESFVKGFEHFYGNTAKYAVLALLPSYLEREGSSLIYMAEHLIRLSSYSESGFFLNNHADLYDNLQNLQKRNIPTVLIGVSFALLDFVENYKIDNNQLIVMETGGMKGRRRELPREELHKILKSGFGVPDIHSEYGMTELLSQAYSKGNGVFFTPPWMRIVIRDTQNPLSLLTRNMSGGVNIIDLANLYSCSFIETQDLGKSLLNNSFEIQGRFDESDVRGCNLLIYE